MNNLSAGKPRATLRAGVCEIDITPDRSLELGGGAFGRSTGVMHPIFAKAVMLQSDGARVMLIGCDLLGMDAECATGMRQAVAMATGLPAAAILLACTHTHNAPATVWLRNWGSPDAEYLRWLEKRIVLAATQAADRAAECRLRLITTRCEGLTTNRCSDDPQLADDMLTAMEVLDAEEHTMAWVVNVACHPVNLHKSGRITPDFPHYLQAQLREAGGGEFPVLFFQGASGDLLPANFDGKPREEDAAHTGRRIAECLQAGEPEPVSGEAQVSAASVDAPMPLQPLPAEEDLQEIIDRREPELAKITDPSPTNWKWTGHKTAVEWAREALDALLDDQPETLDIPLQAIRIGPLRVLAVPGELFSEIAIRIRRESDGPLMIVTLANGCEGYLPTAEAYDRGSYEAVHAPRHIGLRSFAPHVGDVLASEAAKLLQRVAR
ncbi:MAG: hypothetical protein ACLFVU_11255 [Phycisphaerae bacterium]